MTSSTCISSGIDALQHFFPVDAPARNTFAGLVFVLVTAGEVTVEIDSRPYTLQPSTLLTLLPSHLLQTITFAPDLQCLTLSFLFDTMADFPCMLQPCISEQIQRIPFIRLIPEDAVRLSALHADILRHHRITAHPFYQEVLRAQLFIFTAEVSTLYAARPIQPFATRNEELTDGFFHLLHENFHTIRTPDFYASRLCISPKHLARVIRNVTGKVPSYWIADFTVREAKMFLRSSSLTVTEISEQLNFSNSSFFARYFKRAAGVSPGEYRGKNGE